MCGLVYIKSFDGQPVGEKIKLRYEQQKHRGQKGFGLFNPTNSSIYRHTEEGPVLKQLEASGLTEGLFHHRNPTSTDNTLTSAHPFTTRNFFKNRNFVLIHNGVIWNAKEMREKHEKLGIKYSSIQPDGRFNDSESLMWEVALTLMGRQEAIETEGGAAFIVIESSITSDNTGHIVPHKLHFARNKSNPLALTLTNQELTLASSSVHDELSQEIMPEFLHTYDYDTKLLSLKPFHVPVHVWPPANAYTPPVKDTRPWAGYGSHQTAGTHATSKPQVALPPRTPIMTSAEIDDAATKLITGLFTKYDTIADVQWRLEMDVKRARQAVKQLATKGGLKPKSATKYTKYFIYLQTARRALARLEMIYDYDTPTT